MSYRLPGSGRTNACALVALSFAVVISSACAVTGCGSSPAAFSVVDSGAVADSTTGDANMGAQLAAPTFTPPDGTVFEGGGMVTISGPAGATLCYTTDGTIPNTAQCKAYLGPLAVVSSGTIYAVAHESGFKDSPAAHATYTVETEGGAEEGGDAGPQALTFNPTQESSNNDFNLTITGTPGATICYTVDGSTPTCGSNGTCGGSSKSYGGGGAGGIAIDGTVTNAATGSVTVMAIQCGAGAPSGAAVSQTYVLVVADPTMALGGTNVPKTTGMTDVPWPTGQPGLAPIVQTATVDSTAITDAVSIRYLTTGQMPTCMTGTQVPSPTTFNSTAFGAPNPPLSSNLTYQTIGCKQGYLASNVIAFPFTIQLATPTLPAAGTFGSVPTLTPTDTANSAGTTQADTLCITTVPGITGTTPTCGTSGGCGTGSVATASFLPGNGTSASTTVTAIACPPTSNPNLVPSSASASVTYTLQLAAPFAASGDTAEQGLPGWAFGTGGAGTPNTSFTVPSGSATPYPTGDTGATCAVHDTEATPHCVWQVGVVEPMPACGGNEFYATGTTVPAGCTLNKTPDYFCYTTSSGATAGCGTTAGTCTGTGALSVAVSTTGGPGPATSLVTAAGVATGGVVAQPATPDTLSIIACQNAGAAAMFGASAPTTIGPVNPPGTATQPTATPAGGPQTSQAVVSVSNGDANPSVICFTTDASTPTCGITNGKATCGGTGTTWCGQNAAAPATGAATCNSGVSTSVIAPNSSFTIPSVLAGTTNEYLQSNLAAGGTLHAVTCNLVEATSAVYTPATAFAFTMAPPDFGAKPQVNGSPGDTTYDTAPANPVGAGTTVWLSATSNFDFDSTAQPAMSIHWAWNGAPSCTTTATNCPTGATNCGSVNPGSFSVSTTSHQVVSNWSLSGTTAQGFTTIPTPTSGTTATLEAIACGQSTSLQSSSSIAQVTFQVQAAPPIIITNESCIGTAAQCGTGCGVTQFPITAASGGSNAQLQAVQGTVCPATPTWQRPIKFQLADATAHATLCYTTNGSVPHCTGGTCNAASTQVIDTAGVGPITATLTVDGTATNLRSGVIVQAAACTATLPEMDMTPVTFTLETSPIDLYDGSGNAVQPGQTLVCGLNNATDVTATSLQGAQDASSTTYQAGGPTADECFCYTTDGSQPNTSGCASAGSCPAATTGSTTCAAVNATSGGTLGTVVAVGIDQSLTLNYATCVAGLNAAYNGVSSAPAFLVSPYVHTINVDGTTTDWTIAGQNGATLNEEAITATPVAPPKNGVGMLTYDAATLYFGFLNTGGNGTVAAPLGIQLGTGDAVGILVGNGVSAGAPQTIPSGTGFAATTLQVGEGALYFITWALNSTSGSTAVVYQWSNGAWAQASGITVTAKTGVTGGDNDFEMSVPLSELPLLGATPTQVTVMGLYDTGVGGTPSTTFSWPNSIASGGGNVDDGWFNVFLGSCVAPAFKDATVPAGVVSTNPGH